MNVLVEIRRERSSYLHYLVKDIVGLIEPLLRPIDSQRSLHLGWEFEVPEGRGAMRINPEGQVETFDGHGISTYSLDSLQRVKPFLDSGNYDWIRYVRSHGHAEGQSPNPRDPVTGDLYQIQRGRYFIYLVNATHPEKGKIRLRGIRLHFAGSIELKAIYPNGAVYLTSGEYYTTHHQIFH